MPFNPDMPDPDDRSHNNPAVYLTEKHLYTIYNKVHEGEKKRKITPEMKKWFINEALNFGWDSIEFSGINIILKVDIPSRKPNTLNLPQKEVFFKDDLTSTTEEDEPKNSKK